MNENSNEPICSKHKNSAQYNQPLFWSFQPACEAPIRQPYIYLLGSQPPQICSSKIPAQLYPCSSYELALLSMATIDEGDIFGVFSRNCIFFAFQYLNMFGLNTLCMDIQRDEHGKVIFKSKRWKCSGLDNAIPNKSPTL